jgi:hypothetical protein
MSLSSYEAAATSVANHCTNVFAIRYPLHSTSPAAAQSRFSTPDDHRNFLPEIFYTQVGKVYHDQMFTATHATRHRHAHTSVTYRPFQAPGGVARKLCTALRCGLLAA